MPPPFSISINLDQIGPWLAATVVVLGWLYNNRKANERENRKDCRESLNQLSKTVADLKSLSIKYHTGSAHSPELATEIKSNLSIIGMKVSLLEFIETENSTKFLIKLRKVITTNNFDSKTKFTSYKKENPRIHLMTAECDSFLYELENSYISFYFRK